MNVSTAPVEGSEMWVGSTIAGSYQGRLVLTRCYCCEAGCGMNTPLFWAPPGSAHVCYSCWPEKETE